MCDVSFFLNLEEEERMNTTENMISNILCILIFEISYNIIIIHISQEHQHYQACCGTLLCHGCIQGVSRAAGDRMDDLKSCCPFCRTPIHKTKTESVKRSEKRVELGDVAGIYSMAGKYKDGLCWVKENKRKWVELIFKAVELGEHRGAYNNLGEVYMAGYFVKKDEKKAMYCFELSASMGEVNSRHVIGCMATLKGDVKTAVKHFMLGAMAGHLLCLREIQQGFNLGFVTKEESETALRRFHEAFDSMRSDQRP